MCDRFKYHKEWKSSGRPREGLIRKLLSDPYGAIRGRSNCTRSQQKEWEALRTESFFLEFIEFANCESENNPKNGEVTGRIAVRLAIRRFSGESWCFVVRAICALAAAYTMRNKYRQAEALLAFAAGKDVSCDLCLGAIAIEQSRVYISKAVDEDKASFTDLAVEEANEALARFVASGDDVDRGKALLFRGGAHYIGGRLDMAMADTRNALKLFPGHSRFFFAGLLNYCKQLADERSEESFAAAKRFMPTLRKAFKKSRGVSANRERVRWLSAVLMVGNGSSSGLRFRARRILLSVLRNFAYLGMGIEAAAVLADLVAVIYPDRKAIAKIMTATFRSEEFVKNLAQHGLAASAERLAKVSNRRLNISEIPREAFEGRCSLLVALDWDPTLEIRSALLEFRTKIERKKSVFPSLLDLDKCVRCYPRTKEVFEVPPLIFQAK